MATDMIRQGQRATTIRSGMTYEEAEPLFSTKKDLYGYFIEEYESEAKNQAITQRQFCDIRHVLLVRFAWWIQQFRKGRNRQERLEKRSPVHFIEVTPVPCIEHQLGEYNGETGGVEVELRRTGHRIKVLKDFDGSHLLRVVSVLEGCQ